MQRKKQLKYNVNRYPPPDGTYFDQENHRDFIAKTNKMIYEKKDSPWPLSCTHCFEPSHCNPIDCQNPCGTCQKNHSAPCPLLYCSYRWWRRYWERDPPAFVQVKPTPEDEELLIEAKALTKNGKDLHWLVPPLNRDPLRSAAAAQNTALQNSMADLSMQNQVPRSQRQHRPQASDHYSPRRRDSRRSRSPVREPPRTRHSHRQRSRSRSRHSCRYRSRSRDAHRHRSHSREPHRHRSRFRDSRHRRSEHRSHARDSRRSRSPSRPYSRRVRSSFDESYRRSYSRDSNRVRSSSRRYSHRSRSRSPRRDTHHYRQRSRTTYPSLLRSRGVGYLEPGPNFSSNWAGNRPQAPLHPPAMKEEFDEDIDIKKEDEDIDINREYEDTYIKEEK